MIDQTVENRADETPSTPSPRRYESVPAWKGSDHIDAILLRLDALRARKGHGSYVLGMTSCGAGAGVSTLAANLAIRAAQLKLGKVLLIDANLRRPRLAQIFKTHRKGLLNVLAGDAEMADVLVPGKFDDLAILPAGSIRPTSLVPEAVEGILKEFRVDFDFVILDMPPIRNNTNSLLFSRTVDGLAMVVEAGKTKARDAKAAQHILEENGAELVGTILNRARRTLPRWLERMT